MTKKQSGFFSGTLCNSGKNEGKGYNRSEKNAPVERPDGKQKLQYIEEKMKSSRQSRLESQNATNLLLTAEG